MSPPRPETHAGAAGRSSTAGPRATVVASLVAAGDLEVLRSSETLRETVGILEVRADLVGELALEQIRRAWPGPVLFALRSAAEGGRSELEDEERAALLVAAAKEYDFVDLEHERDLRKAVLAAVAPGQRVLSWHGRAGEAELRARLKAMSTVEAHRYKLIVEPVEPGDELAPMELYAEAAEGAPRGRLVAFAMGETGRWTRLLAPRLGAPWMYAALPAGAAAPGQLAVEELVSDYGLPELRPVESLFGIVGHPVAHSLSPRLHNGAYRDLGLPALFLPFDAPRFADFWLEVVESDVFDRLGLPLLGFAVTAPHKDAALAVAGASSPRAQRIDSANTLVRTEGVWQAESTDPEGVIGPLLERGVELEGAAAVVVGAGGAGRAAVLGLLRAGADVVVANRSEARGVATAEALGVPFVPLGPLKASEWDVLVNATALGHGADDPLPFALDDCRPGAAVVDMVYGAETTPLVRRAREHGLVVVEGREVLLAQAVAQFAAMTGRELPLAAARRRLGLEALATATGGEAEVGGAMS